MSNFRYYATWTGTRQNLAAMEAAHIGLILGPDQLERGATSWGFRYGLDNGAWGAFQRGGAFDSMAFWAVLERWGKVWQSSQAPDWIVAPDVVGGGLDSLALSLRWLSYVRQYGRPLLAVQDGMSVDDVARYVDDKCGIFVGGSTEWKWATLSTWARLAKDMGAYIHCGRVNSARGIAICRGLGVDSADGTSCTRFSVNAERLGKAANDPAVQLGMWGAS